MLKLRRIAAIGGACLLGASGYGYFSGNQWFYRHVVMPAVSHMDPEKAHVTAVYLTSKGLVAKDRTTDPQILGVTVWGKTFSNPIGLAAGFDKHAEAYRSLLGDMGFGFVEVGSITPLPQPGNPRPRLFRLPKDKAVINRYGFNSHGHQAVRERLKPWREQQDKLPGKQLGVNLGVNKNTKDTVQDYLQGIRSLGEFADYIVINVSCPNSPGLKSMQGKGQLAMLLDKVVEQRDQLPNRPPLLVKIAPDLTDRDKEDIAAVVTREKGGANGLIVSNSTMSRPASLQSPARAEAGGLTGEPLKAMSTATIRDMYVLTNGSLPIIGVGGVSSGRDAYEKIAAGATLVQVYTAFSYEGPPLVARVKRELAQILEMEGFPRIQSAVGTSSKR